MTCIVLHISPLYRRRSHRPLSARRAVGHERRAAVDAPSEKFFDSRVRLALVCPEIALMYAVLEDVFLCFYMQFQTERPFIQRAREAEEWFFTDDSHRLFSFVSVCEALELEPQFIRKKPKVWSESCVDIAHKKI